MPKIVDPEERRTVIADALFAVLRDGGFASVSLANVAARADLAIGSVRHYLGSREELIRFAFDTMVARVGGRVAARADSLLAALDDASLSTADRLEGTVDILCELIPIDSARRDEAIVWLEFETAARTDSELARISQRAAAKTNELLHRVLSTAARQINPDTTVDLAVETTRLAALVDGLTLHGTLRPGDTSPALVRRVLATHLSEFARTVAETG